MNGFIEALIFEGILEKGGGGWIKYKEDNLARGMKSFREVLDGTPELLEELEQALKEIRG